MKLPISQIRLDGGTQSRGALDRETIDTYMESMQAGATFPPVIVYHDGSEYWMADGFHRIEAARRNGATEIDCDVKKGTVKDARWHSAGANLTHGLRRTNAHKRHAVELALRCNSGASDRAIADHCGVSHTFVANVRATGNGCQSGTRTGRDGRSYDTSRIGRPARDSEADEVLRAMHTLAGVSFADGLAFIDWACQQENAAEIHSAFARSREFAGEFMQELEIRMANAKGGKQE